MDQVGCGDADIPPTRIHGGNLEPQSCRFSIESYPQL